MSQTIAGRLDELGIELPSAAKSVANYLPVAQAGSIILTSGQLPLAGGKLTAKGLLGRELDGAAGAL
ncbi:Atu1372/SO_1960 family protein, partial [Mesorhizobium sp. VK2D]